MAQKKKSKTGGLREHNLLLIIIILYFLKPACWTSKQQLAAVMSIDLWPH